MENWLSPVNTAPSPDIGRKCKDLHQSICWRHSQCLRMCWPIRVQRHKIYRHHFHISRALGSSRLSVWPGFCHWFSIEPHNSVCVSKLSYSRTFTSESETKSSSSLDWVTYICVENVGILLLGAIVGGQNFGRDVFELFARIVIGADCRLQRESGDGDWDSVAERFLGGAQRRTFTSSGETAPRIGRGSLFTSIGMQWISETHTAMERTVTCDTVLSISSVAKTKKQENQKKNQQSTFDRHERSLKTAPTG